MINRTIGTTIAIGIFAIICLTYAFHAGQRNAQFDATRNDSALQAQAPKIRLCATVRDLDYKDITSGYDITHAIIQAQLPEDTITTMIEECDKMII